MRRFIDDEVVPAEPVLAGDDAGAGEARRGLSELLSCGVLARGFARVRCGDCAFERLVPFSCKGRGFCPSCGGRRMNAQAAHLVDAVRWLWYLVALLPVLGLLRVGEQAVADRYTYIPGVGLSVMAAWSGAELIRRRPSMKPVVGAAATCRGRGGRVSGALMLHGKKIVVVLPAYRAELTLERTYRDIPHNVVDRVLLVDDGSDDGTVEVARALGVETFLHERNLGYGANQKTCYLKALSTDADIVVMLHPDYQYDPRLITPMSAMVASGVYDVVLGSRILGNTARSGGMPLYKYVANRLLTAFENLMIGAKLSEFHTGYRAFSRRVLEELPLLANADDFVFDNQMLVQAVAAGFAIGEVSCPAKYFPEASSIGFRRSVIYGLGVLRTSVLYRLWRWGLCNPRMLSRSPAFRFVPDSTGAARVDPV